MTLESLLKTVATIEIKGALDQEIAGIAYDSRQVIPGGLFVAIHGVQTDGSQYVGDALSNGAVAVISENDFDVGAGITHIRVKSARVALAEIANTFYGDLSRQMKMVGITGTNGKTTTAYMTREVLRAGGLNPGLLGTVAYEIGERMLPSIRTTPESPDIHAFLQQMQSADCDSAVMEVSSHAIALHRVHGIRYAVRVFTNLTRDHLDYHKDMESYFKVKSRLFHSADAEDGGPLAINADDPWGQKLMSELPDHAEALTYGFAESAAVRADHIDMNINRTRFDVTTPWGEDTVRLKLLGQFNISNALAALTVGGLLGIELSCMIKALEGIHSVPGRLEAIPNRRHKKIFVDYAHTDDALRNVLQTLRELCRGRLVVVFGCGGDRDRGKRMLMGAVADELADYTIVTSDNPRSEDPGLIAGQVVKGFSNSDAVEVVLDRREAIARGIETIKRQDILLVAGKGHETSQELKETTIPFDDREVVREILGK